MKLPRITVFKALLTISVLCIIFFQVHIYNLVSIKTMPTYSVGANWEESVLIEKKEMTVKALSLLKRYLDEEFVVKQFHYTTANLIKIEIVANGIERSFYMLPDGLHIIEGVLYSPFALPTAVTTQQSTKQKDIAQKNKSKFVNRNQLNNEFKRTVLTTEQTKELRPTAITADTAKEKLRLPSNNSIIKQGDKRDIFNRTQQLDYIEAGDNNAPLVYVYFDFNCSGCQKAKKELQKHTDSGKLRVRYIPVGVITEESAVKAALTMIPDDNVNRTALFDYFNDRGEVQTLLDQKVPEKKFKQGQIRMRDANAAFFGLPKTVTPTFLFESEGVVQITNPVSSRSIEKLVTQLNK